VNSPNAHTLVDSDIKADFQHADTTVRALERHRPIEMINIKTVGIIACVRIGNDRRGRPLFMQLWRVSNKNGGAVWTALDSKLSQYSVMRSHKSIQLRG